METRVVINGRVLTKKTAGIPRYAFEIVKRLDRMKPREIMMELAVPPGKTIGAKFENIQIFEPKSCVGGVYGLFGTFFPPKNTQKKNERLIC